MRIPLSIFSFFLLFCAKCLAQNPININNSDTISPVDFVFFEDSSAKKGIEEIASNQVNFKKFSTKNINFGFSNSAFWLRCKLINNENFAIEKTLALDNKDLDLLEFYMPSDSNQFIKQTSGDFQLKTDKEGKSFFPTFKINIPAQTKSYYYLKVKSTSNLDLNFKIWEPQQYQNFMLLHTRFLGILMGILLLRLVNIGIFIRLSGQKKAIYYFYAVLFYVFTTVVSSMKIGSISPGQYNYITNTFYYLSPLAVAIWVFKQLFTPEIAGKLRLIFYFILVCAALGIYWLWLQPNQYLPVKSAMAFTALANFLLLTLYLKNINTSLPKFYNLALIFFTINSSLYPITCLGLVPFHSITFALLTLSIIIETVVMTYLLGKYSLKIWADTRQKNFENKLLNEINNQNTKSADVVFIEKLNEILNYNLHNPKYDIETISAEMHISSTQLRRKIKNITGFTTVEYIRKMRLKKAAKLLSQRTGTVSEIGYQVGFENLSYFAKAFQAEYDCLPSQFGQETSPKD